MMRSTLIFCLIAPFLSSCAVANFKTGRLYVPSTYKSLNQCAGQTHTRRIMTQNGINEDYMMADCAGIPPYNDPQRLEGR
jgi:hypothetical protein